MAARGLPFGKQPHVILDPAQDGEVVFIDVEDVQGWPLRLCRQEALLAQLLDQATSVDRPTDFE